MPFFMSLNYIHRVRSARGRGAALGGVMGEMDAQRILLLVPFLQPVQVTPFFSSASPSFSSIH